MQFTTYNQTIQCLQMHTMLRTEFLKRPKGESQSETTKEKKNCNILLNSQHFGGRKACWSSEMKLKQTHKEEFKMKSTCIIKKIRQLMKVEWK